MVGTGGVQRGQRVVHVILKTLANRLSMEAKVAALRDVQAYPDPPLVVEVSETHRSWVFFTGGTCYKLKKPVHDEALNFGTVETRQFCCQEELRLNRRLAQGVYMGAAPLKLDAQGALHIEGEGDVVDWLIKMRRLPADAMLDRMLVDGRATAEHMQRLAQRLVDFYRGQLPALADPARYTSRLQREIDELERDLSDPAYPLPAQDVQRLCAGLRGFVGTHFALFSARALAGKIVEGHGDLRPEHIYLGEPLAIIDCLESSRELRVLDTVDELGFLALECEMMGAPELGRALLDAYGAQAGEVLDAPHAALIHFYQSFRAGIRAYIAIHHLAEERYRESPKWLDRTHRYLQLAAQHIQGAEAALSCGPPMPAATA